VKPHILLVDDEAALCEMLSLYFGEMGLKVFAAATPQQARDLITKIQMHAIILDLNLAGEDGLEVLRFAKNTIPNVPVIIFTGLDVDEHLVKKCLADRADGFIRKTAGPGALLAEVRRHLPPASIP
jgi:DNA-binding response OmpR family regulator